jgi:hypothetical protein
MYHLELGIGYLYDLLLMGVCLLFATAEPKVVSRKHTDVQAIPARNQRKAVLSLYYGEIGDKQSHSSISPAFFQKIRYVRLIWYTILGREGIMLWWVSGLCRPETRSRDDNDGIEPSSTGKG